MRDYHCARAIGEVTELTYVYFRDCDSGGPSSSDMPFCRKIIPVQKPVPYTAGKIARGLIGRTPLPVLNYYSTEMAVTLQQVGSQERFDLVHFDSLHMAPYEASFSESAGAASRMIYDWHNIESEAMRRYCLEAPSVLKKIYASATARRLESLETALLKNAFAHIVCSKREETVLKNRVPAARIEIIPNGVDGAHFEQPNVLSRWPPQKMIFVGSMNYYPNVEAATWFVEHVWPIFLGRFPRCRLTLVGSEPVPAVLKLGDVEGVEVTGTVDDVRRFYHAADIALVPLRLGGGTRLKILEAMAAGVPVISTALGAEGLDIQPGRNILIAGENDPDSWLRAALNLESQQQTEELRLSAKQLVRERYDWKVIGKSLREIYLAWSGCAS